MSACTYNCTCAEGGCDISSCANLCSCDGGNCDLSSVPSSGEGFDSSTCLGGGCKLSKDTLLEEKKEGSSFCGGTFAAKACYADDFMFAECETVFGTTCICDSDGDKECDLTVCSRDCTCNGATGGCDMSTCTEKCTCEGGDCDMSTCVKDCSNEKTNFGPTTSSSAVASAVVSKAGCLLVGFLVFCYQLY